MLRLEQVQKQKVILVITFPVSSCDPLIGEFAGLILLSRPCHTATRQIWRVMKIGLHEYMWKK